MPCAGIGVVFFVRKRVILAQFQARCGAEYRDAINLAPCGGDMLFIAPVQTTIEIKLPFFQVAVVCRVGARKRVIA